MKNLELLVFALLILVSSCETNNKDGNTKKIPSSKIIKTLDSLGYFNLTPLVELDSLKTDLVESYENLNLFEGKRFYDSSRYVDFRFYWLDGEELFEDGGIVNYLNEIKPTFDKLDLNLDFKNDSIATNKSNLVHSIVINDSNYTAYSGERNYSSWGIATYNFAKILNDVLKKQRSNERIYLISGGNDGRMVFLTSKVYSYLKTVYEIDDEFPLEVEEWAIKNEVPN